MPPNPLLGLTYDPAFIADFLHSITGPIVLVGHSYGGAVITNAATGDDRSRPSSTWTPSRPTRARPSASWSPPCPAPASWRLTRPPSSTFATYPGAPAGVFDAYYKQNLFPACFANGLPLSEAKVLAATQEPLSTIALSQPSGVPAWKTIPSWAVVGTADHVIPPAVQLAMARHAHAHITEVNAPHLSMISDPGRRHPGHPQGRARDRLIAQ